MKVYILLETKVPETYILALKVIKALKVLSLNFEMLNSLQYRVSRSARYFTSDSNIGLSIEHGLELESNNQ